MGWYIYTYVELAIKKSTMANITSAWCAGNKNDAFTSLKNSKEIKKMNCINPIDEHQKIINKIGISSTPSIFLPDGKLILGYKSPKDIIGKIKN